MADVVDSIDGCIHLTPSRRLTYRAWGPTDGLPVMALHGTPGSRLKFNLTEHHAFRLGLRVIAPDRWGYGGTDTFPDVSKPADLHAFAADIANFAEQLSLEHFAVLGVSGGGPYAVALAALLPARVTALALFAPVGPIAREPDRDISAFHAFCFGGLARRPLVVGAIFRGFRALLHASPQLAMRLAMARAPAADRRVLADVQVSKRLALTFLEGLKMGANGPVTDLALFGRPWGLPLANIVCPARLWIGKDDRNVPMSAARRLADRIDNCIFTEIADAGHLWVAQHYGELLDWVADTITGAAFAAPDHRLVES